MQRLPLACWFCTQYVHLCFELTRPPTLELASLVLDGGVRSPLVPQLQCSFLTKMRESVKIEKSPSVCSSAVVTDASSEFSGVSFSLWGGRLSGRRCHTSDALWVPLLIPPVRLGRRCPPGPLTLSFLRLQMLTVREPGRQAGS